VFEITTNPVPVTTPRGRRKRVVLTNRDCEGRNAHSGERKKYDAKCAGLYVSRNATGPNTFSMQVRDRFTGKTRSLKLGAYDRETFNIEHARAAYYAVMARIGAGENVFEAIRQGKTMKAKQGLTVAQLIELRIDWMSAPERKADAEMRPRIESWANVASHLRRLVLPTFGERLAIEVTRSEIAKLSDDIVAGKYDGKPSIANARHMRRAVSGLYAWGSQAGRDFVPIDCRPAVNLPKLPPEHPRERVLTADEIKIFWHGLDREDMPWDRKTRLALKFQLTTMLRSAELLSARRDELFDLDGENPRFDVPLRRVKKRRTIQQPLSDLAVEIIKEALKDSDRQYVFASPLGDQPMERKSTATALRGTRYANGKIKSIGVCELLGLKPFTPHDLRRTAATLAGDLGYSDGAIAACLDHRTVTDEHGARIPTVTGRVYQHSRRLNQKRVVLDGIAKALRAIVDDEETSEVKSAA
jgi:integrase